MTPEIVQYPQSDDIARWAIACREAVNLTQEQWAVQTGISSSTVSRIERGLVVPHKKTLWRMWQSVKKAGKTPPSLATTEAPADPVEVGAMP